MNQLLEQHIVPAMSAMSMSALFTSSPSTTSLTDQLDFEEINREPTHNKMVVTMKSISLKVAEAIADTVIHTAISRNYAPITVVVLDSWGHTVVSKRMDGCAPVGMLIDSACNFFHSASSATST